MTFYAGTADDEAELPYGVVIARDFEETIRGDGCYYGNLQVRLVHDIDDFTADAHDKILRETQLALVNLHTPVADPDNAVTVLGMTPQKTQQAPGKNVFVDIIPIVMGVADLDPDSTSTIERRTEKAFAEHLTARTTAQQSP